MGACMATEDVKIGEIGRQAVGANMNAISDADLEGALGLANSQTALKTRVSLSFSAEKLPNMDTGSKTDAFVVLYMMETNGGRWTRMGETEVVADSLDPKWVTSISVDYFFEKQQTFKLEIYDADDSQNMNDLTRHDFVGRAEFALGKVVASPNQEMMTGLEGGARSKGAKVKIASEEKRANYGQFQAIFGMELKISGQDSNNVFITINKFKSPGKYGPIYKSEIKPQTKGVFQYNELTTDTDTLCNNEDDQEILIQIFKYQASGSHKKISQIYTSLSEFKVGQNQPISATLSGDKGAQLTINNFRIQPRVSFLDYIFGGCEIGLHVAIDFTLSNGDVQSPDSLHYLNHRGINDYTKAITAVMNILKDYDTDQMYPVYGFGGRLENSPSGAASHCFALNGDIFSPECNQLEGILAAYYNARTKVQLYGPTYFSSILKWVNDYTQAQAAEISQCNQMYNIVLILTDGIINDMDKTIDEIVKASDQPLSIIIVGVGQADFEQMEQLDGDVTPLYSHRLRKYRNRDIVQFVPFRDLQGDPIRLAKEVLAEVPKQMTDYFIQKRIRPNPMKMKDRQEILIRNKMRNQMAMMMKKPNNFFDFRKQMLMQNCTNMMMSPEQVMAFINTIGIAEEDPMWVMKYKDVPGYRNILKF